MTEFMNDELIPPIEEPFYYDGKYLYENQWYHEKFPLSWASCHIKATGPNECSSCVEFGYIYDVFIGYCVTCATNIYKGHRGRGFVGNGQEYNNVSLSYPSAFDTYLKCVDINAITPVTDDSIPIQKNIYVDNLNENDSSSEPYEDCEYDTFSSIINPDYEGGYNDC